MTRRIALGCLLAAPLLVVFLSCAPVDEPAAGEPGPPAAEAALPLPERGGEAIAAAPAAEVPDGLRQRIEAAVRNVRQRDLLTTNGFWTVFHGILGLGPGVQLLDPRTKERVGALDYICKGGNLRGLYFRPTPVGVDVVTTQDTIGQGHQDQFIAEMAQWGMPLDRKFRVQGQEYTFADFVNQSQMRARVTARQELSWTILIVAQYKGLDAQWRNVFREDLRFEDLLRYELEASVEAAPCGGTHRLFGLTWAYHLHLQKGGKAEGVWAGVAARTAQYRDKARKFRNADGSFSTDFFRGPGNAADKNRRINTTGHILEWLALALSDEELREPWVQEAAHALCLQILDLQGAAIDGGSMYHAVHGLLIYYARVFDRSICPPELLVPLPPGWKKV